MSSALELVKRYKHPDYNYGGHTHIEVVRLTPHIGSTALDPLASLEYINNPEQTSPLYSDEQVMGKVEEIANNYTVIKDPDARESRPIQFGVTIANADQLYKGRSAIVIFSSSAASLYDEDGNANTVNNAIEMAYTAFKYPDNPIVYVELPGNGNSTNLSREEYDQAAKDGKLVHEERAKDGHIKSYKAFEIIEGLGRALEEYLIKSGMVDKISHITANEAGTLVDTALASVLPFNTLERNFLYNPTNISDRNGIWFSILTMREIMTQGKYSRASNDPLKISTERQKMARDIMNRASTNIVKIRIQQARAATHNPIKLKNQRKMFRRGNKHGQAAAVQLVTAQMQHPDLKQTLVLPAFAAHYKRPEDFIEFMRLIAVLGGQMYSIEDLESLSIPLGQYGHSHFPSARQMLEGYGFNR